MFFSRAARRQASLEQSPAVSPSSAAAAATLSSGGDGSGRQPQRHKHCGGSGCCAPAQGHRYHHQVGGRRSTLWSSSNEEEEEDNDDDDDYYRQSDDSVVGFQGIESRPEAPTRGHLLSTAASNDCERNDCGAAPRTININNNSSGGVSESGQLVKCVSIGDQAQYQLQYELLPPAKRLASGNVGGGGGELKRQQPLINRSRAEVGKQTGTTFTRLLTRSAANKQTNKPQTTRTTITTTTTTAQMEPIHIKVDEDELLSGSRFSPLFQPAQMANHNLSHHNQTGQPTQSALGQSQAATGINQSAGINGANLADTSGTHLSRFKARDLSYADDGVR